MMNGRGTMKSKWVVDMRCWTLRLMLFWGDMSWVLWVDVMMKTHFIVVGINRGFAVCTVAG